MEICASFSISMKTRFRGRCVLLSPVTLPKEWRSHTRSFLLSFIGACLEKGFSQSSFSFRDLKSPNIFLSRDTTTNRITAKVADLGLAEVLPKASKVLGVDNPVWAAPEVIQGLQCTETADVFSFAIILWELLYPAAFPYSDALDRLRWMSLLGDEIALGLRPTMHDLSACPPPTGYVALMEHSWSGDPVLRPSFAEAILALRAMLPPPLARANVASVVLDALFNVSLPAQTDWAILHGQHLLLSASELLECNLSTSALAPVSSRDVERAALVDLARKDGLDSLRCYDHDGELWVANMTSLVQVLRKDGTLTALPTSFDCVWGFASSGRRTLFSIGSLTNNASRVSLGQWMR